MGVHGRQRRRRAGPVRGLSAPGRTRAGAQGDGLKKPRRRPIACGLLRPLLATTLLVLMSAIACTRSVPPTSTLRGVLLQVAAPSLTQVDSFSVRDDAGQVWDFRAASDFNAGATHVMTPGHMRQHMALGDPVTITYRAEGSTLIALSPTD